MSTSPSVSYGTTITDQLSLAAAEIDRHATSHLDGYCETCHLPGPCPRRETAVAIFSRYHRLPLARYHPGPEPADEHGGEYGGEPTGGYEAPR